MILTFFVTILLFSNIDLSYQQTATIKQSFCLNIPNSAFNIVKYKIMNIVSLPSLSACCNVCGKRF